MSRPRLVLDTNLVLPALLFRGATVSWLRHEIGAPAVPDCRDPFDRPFLELALAGRADALITGDDDLLVLAPQFSIPILTAAASAVRLSQPPHA